MTETAAPTRLEQLLELRRRIDQEISREHTYQTRVKGLVKDIRFVVTTRGGWNDRVIQATCSYFAVSVNKVLGDSRSHNARDARHVAAWLMRDAGRSYPEIGSALHKDHTSAMYALKRVNATPMLLTVASELRAQLLGEDMEETA